MEVAVLIFLTSGLFLGWSLGANDSANVFGTAVGSGMLKFATAAILCSVFVILGSVISGAGAAHTLGQLGSINALAGSFMCALAAALTVYVMTRLGLPVSTGQAIVGGIVGWNLYSGFPTDTSSLTKIVGTWVACPLLSAVIAVVLYRVTAAFLNWARLHILSLDYYTRIALILAGAFGSYALGANNIANVMGVFLPANPFSSFSLGPFGNLTAVQQLFLIGAIAIAVGVFTYSRRVMMTVGQGLFPLTPVAAWVVVMAHSIVLFLFASQGLENFLAKNGLPTIPLVPVSSSQAVVGAVIGIGLLKGRHAIRWRQLLGIESGWVTTPVIACGVCFMSLFFLENVFKQQVYVDVSYSLSSDVIAELADRGIDTRPLAPVVGKRFNDVRSMRAILEVTLDPAEDTELRVLRVARLRPILIRPSAFPALADTSLSDEQKKAVRALAGQNFLHDWQLDQALAKSSETWRTRPETIANKLHNNELRNQRREIYRIFGGG